MSMVRYLRRFGAVLLLVAAGSVAAAPWESLPPTPQLPPAKTSGYAAVRGVRLWYATFGDGRPVVLLHGGFGNSSYWGHLVPALVAAHHSVVVIDSRGHGRSTRSAERYTYALMADDVLAVLDQLKLARVDVVGWSDGGIIGLDLAMRHPERLRRLIAYGANSDPSGVYDDTEQKPVFASYLARVREEYARLSPTPKEFDAFGKQIEEMWAHEPHYSTAELARIRTPTLIADGAHEEAIRREHTEYLARTIPGAKLAILDDASHFGMLQVPDEFNAMVIRFLAH